MHLVSLQISTTTTSVLVCTSKHTVLGYMHLVTSRYQQGPSVLVCTSKHMVLGYMHLVSLQISTRANHT